MVIGQLRTDSKSNEITAIPELIKLLDLKGALVSIDAMGCQKEIAKSIIEQKADYVLALKGNQAKFAESRQAVSENLVIEKQHGRIEARSYYVLNAKEIAKNFPDWPSLKTVGMAMGYRQEKGKEPSLEYRYYISSANLTQGSFAEAVREHWAVENNLHWVLDASMKEDDCQIYKDNGAENLAILRQTSLNMLRAESTKASIPTKQKRAWMKTSFLEQILRAGLGEADEN